MGSRNVWLLILVVTWLRASRNRSRYRPGNDRGSPKYGSTLLSKRAIAQIRSPDRASTIEADAVADAVGGADIGPERGLAVGPGRHEIEPAARAENAGAEPRHRFPALVLKRHRRHRHENIVGQQSHQRIEIGRLLRADEFRHHRILGGRAGSGRRLAVTALAIGAAGQREPA